MTLEEIQRNIVQLRQQRDMVLVQLGTIDGQIAMLQQWEASLNEQSKEDQKIMAEEENRANDPA